MEKLFTPAKLLQKNTARKWNSDCDEPSLLMYLELLGIDESISKECAAIILDLLLRARFLVENKVGRWSLADDYESGRIYLFGDTKTIENMTKFVRGMQDRKVSYSVANLQSDILLQVLD